MRRARRPRSEYEKTRHWSGAPPAYGRPSGVGSTMQRATTRGGNATDRYYNLSAHLVKHAGYDRPVSFSRLFVLQKGVHMAGGPDDHAIPCIAPSGPRAVRKGMSVS